MPDRGGAKSCSCYGALLWRHTTNIRLQTLCAKKTLAHTLVSRCQQNTVVRCGWLFPHLRLEERYVGLMV